jgi:hypothetical protein
MSEENYDRWHPLYYTTQGFPDEVNDAFAAILQHLEEVQSMCNVKVTGPLNRVFDSLDSLPRKQKTKVSEWRQQVYREERSRREQMRVDRIKGFEIGQLVKFIPDARHHEEDGNYPWGISHIIGRVARRNQNTVSVIEVSRRRQSSDVEQTNYTGVRWRMLPGTDSIINE